MREGAVNLIIGYYRGDFVANPKNLLNKHNPQVRRCSLKKKFVMHTFWNL